jgi:hypothetical protein
MLKKQIEYMANRFLGWKLPQPWNPDNGISYRRPNYAHPPADHDWPTGTNLFDATQAVAMVSHMVEGLPQSDDFRWLIEAPGPKYLAVQTLTGAGASFEWTSDHNRALAFRSQEQADSTLAALRLMDRALTAKINHGKLSWGDLFAFEPSLGNAKAIEHGWRN